MSPIAATSLSGLQAAQSALGAAAHNIANAATEGFRRQTLHTATALPGGVSVTSGQAVEPGSAMVTDLVASLQARNAWVANLQVFKTESRMLGALLDARA
jgi:flagellar hook protein FlgE